MSADLPRPDLPFDAWFATQYMDRKGRVEVAVRLNTYIDQATVLDRIDMASWRAEKRLARLWRRAERLAARRNRAVEVAERVLDR